MKTQFQGNPLIEILSKNILSYNFLQGDFGKEFLEEYNGRVSSDYKDNSALKVLTFKDNVVKGSNSHSIFLAEDILFQEGLRTLTPADAQKIINKDENFLRDVYIDLGLVLRTENVPNEYLAKQLGKQAKERGYEFSNENPLVFKASDLELILDENLSLGLGFKIKESANPFNAPELSDKNYYKNFNRTTENGMPIFDKNGKRILYTGKNGLFRLELTKLLDLCSGIDILASSGEGGRIVAVNGGTAKI